MSYWFSDDITELLLSGIQINVLTNTKNDVFWYADKDLMVPYNQDKAKKGDRFWDANNGDSHIVIKVARPKDRRLLYRVLNNGSNKPRLAIWMRPFDTEYVEGTYDKRRQIAMLWGIDDIQSVREDLTDEQAMAVLKEADRRHDANIGITWDTLKYHADMMFPEKENDV